MNVFFIKKSGNNKKETALDRLRAKAKKVATTTTMLGAAGSARKAGIRSKFQAKTRKLALGSSLLGMAAKGVLTDAQREEKARKAKNDALMASSRAGRKASKSAAAPAPRTAEDRVLAMRVSMRENHSAGESG